MGRVVVVEREGHCAVRKAAVSKKAEEIRVLGGRANMRCWVLRPGTCPVPHMPLCTQTYTHSHTHTNTRTHTHTHTHTQKHPKPASTHQLDRYQRVPSASTAATATADCAEAGDTAHVSRLLLPAEATTTAPSL